MADEKKYLDSNGLARLLANLVTAFAAKTHTHTVSELGDYTVDTELSATSTNPVTNQAIKSQFDAVDAALDGKADSGHSHTITAAASDDDVVVLTGTNGINKVTYSASHANSGVTAGTYKSVTVNAKGHVTGGTNPTTLSGYGITDAYTKAQVDSTVSGLNSAIDGKAASGHTHDVATTSAAGFMSTDMVTKLNGIATGATKVTVDSSLSGTSTNPVQNKVINSALSGKVPTTRTVNGHALSANVTLDYEDVGAAAASHTHDDRYYTESEIDAKFDAIMGEGAAETLDTIGEISAAITENDTMLDTLNAAVGNKANASDLTSHTGNTTVHITATERTNWNAAKTHADSAHAPSNAQANQNAWSNIKVGSTTVAADTTTDTLTLIAGSNVTITPDATNDSVTIAATDTVYTHPNSGVTAGTYKSVTVNAQGHVTGGSNPTTLDGYGITDAAAKTHDHTITAAASDDDIVVLTGTNGTNKVTYSASHAASGATAGSYGDSANQTPAYGATFKVPYVTVNATGHVTGISAHTVKIPAAITLSNLGVTATAAELNKLDGVTATTAELNYVDGVTSGIQGQLDSKVPNTRTVNGKALSANITLSAADLGIVSITDDEIDTICGAAIAYAEEMSF